MGYGYGRFAINEVYGPDTSFPEREKGAEGLASRAMRARWGGKRRSPTPNNTHTAPHIRIIWCFPWGDLFSIPACRPPGLIMGIHPLSLENPPESVRQDVIGRESSSETSRVYLGRSAAIETVGLGWSRCALVARASVWVDGGSRRVCGGHQTVSAAEVRFGWEDRRPISPDGIRWA